MTKARHRAGTAMNRQLDLFVAGAKTPFVGLCIRMDRPVDRNRRCCRNLCTITPAKTPHAGELICADCGQHRGWISNETVYWIESVIARFGAPTTPIMVRSFHTCEEEAPAQKK
jgi:hypothetical protein